MKIHFSSLAEADLSEIWHYIAEDNPVAADEVFTHIKGVINKLLHTPKIGRRRDNVFPGIRCLLARNYLIFYLETRDGIEISRILHGAREIKPNLF
jgi:toxin ParE1/3/4